MKRIIRIASAFFFVFKAFSFDSGAVLGVKAFFNGSYTDPHVSKADLATMGASYLKGNTGFVMSGEADFTYIFDSVKYFKMKDKRIFSGLGVQGLLGIGQGFTGEISGKEDIDIFVNVFYTPAITLGAGTKIYLFNSRMIVNFALGTRVIADPTPNYDMYNSRPDILKDVDGVGTIIVTKDMMKKMNPFGAFIRFGAEYIQPVIKSMELTLGFFLSYVIYKPKYITMPPALIEAAKQAKFDPVNTPLKSLFLNSMDFGVSLGLNFKVNP